MSNPTLHIREALESLGYTLSDSGAYWQANAAYRGGDTPTAVQIFIDSGGWIDYVERSTFSPFSELVKLSLGTDNPTDVKQFIETHNISSSSNLHSSLIGKAPPSISSSEKIFPNDCLDGLSKDYSFYNTKDISSSTLSNFSCGVSSSGDMFNRFVFPIFNKLGKIHGLSGRDISGKQSSKWKHMGSKSKWVYPYYLKPLSGDNPVQDAINKERAVILVESIGDMLSLYENGHRNVLVTFGLSISSSLICLLCALNVDKIIISLNNDSNGGNNRGHDAAIANYFRLLNYFDYEEVVICLPCNGKNDFGEMTPPDFRDWEERLNNRDQEKQAKYIVEYFESNLKSKLKNRKSIIAKYNDLKKFLS